MNSKEQTMRSVDLAGIVVGDTQLSDVRGDTGELSYRGVPIAQLANEPFARVVHLLLFGRWPPTAEETQLADYLTHSMALRDADIDILRRLPADLHPMQILQGMLPLLPLTKDSAPYGDLDLAQGLSLAARLPTLIAARHRLVNGQDPVPASPQLSLHENFLVMFHARAPSPEAVRLLDTVQILQLEHSFNAGTFAGRVCASTEAPIQSALSASVGTLFGRLHGGADQAALEMAMAIGSPEKAAGWVTQALARGEKIMGMGHREYRTVDPRASLLKPLALAQCRSEESARLLATLVAVEETCQAHFAEQGKEIHANVEFYKGAVFHSLGIPSRCFTALFAMARVYGYVAHFLEFRGQRKLIRPRARYCATGTPAQES